MTDATRKDDVVDARTRQALEALTFCTISGPLTFTRDQARALIDYFATRTVAASSPPEREGVVGGDLTRLRAANVERQAIWCPDEVPDLSFRGNELSGEVGEACNVIKKLERERHNWRGSRDTKEHLAEELADVVICADLCAITAGIDLASAVVAKFNATSDKVGIPVKLATPILDTPAKPKGAGESGKVLANSEIRAWIEACNYEPARATLRELLRFRATPSAPSGEPVLPYAFITCNSNAPDYFVTIKTQTLRDAQAWHDAVLKLAAPKKQEGTK